MRDSSIVVENLTKTFGRRGLARPGRVPSSAGEIVVVVAAL